MDEKSVSSSFACVLSYRKNNNVAQQQKLMKHLTHYKNVWFPNSEVSQTTYSTMGCNIKLWCNISQISDCTADRGGLQ